MLKADAKELVKFTNHLERFSGTAVPFATRNTLNTAVFTNQKLARGEIRENMTLRNAFTIRGIQVEKATSLKIAKQESRIGSVSPYMAVQEEGGTKVKRGSEGVAIPTAYSAGQGENVQQRTRLPRNANRLANISLQKRKRAGKSRRQRNFIAVREAAASGHKFVFLELTRTKGLFRVVGGKRNPRIKMVYDLTRDSVVIPKNPWLEPTFRETVKRLPDMHAKSLEFQMKRLRLFT